MLPCSAAAVPPLCKEWVMLACAKGNGACRLRHYYVDETEK